MPGGSGPPSRCSSPRNTGTGTSSLHSGVFRTSSDQDKLSDSSGHGQQLPRASSAQKRDKNSSAADTPSANHGAGALPAGPQPSVPAKAGPHEAPKSSLKSEGIVAEWALVFQVCHEARREGLWKLRAGPEQIEFIDDILATAARARGRFPKKKLDLKIFESWLEFRVAMLNALMELLSKHCDFKCEVFRSMGTGTRNEESKTVFVLIHLPEKAAQEHAEKQKYVRHLNQNVPLLMRLPPSEPGQQEYPPGHARFDRGMAAHFLDTHKEELYENPEEGHGNGSVFGMVDRVRLMSAAVEEHIDLSELVATGVVTGHFPLHNVDELTKISHKWARISYLWTWWQPLDEVHKYFGPQTAFYFAWLGFQARSLAPLALVGAVIDGWLTLRWRSAAHDKVGWYMLTCCSALVIVWASFYLRFWFRREAELRLHWTSTLDSSGRSKRPNPNYRGPWKKNPVTGDSYKKNPARRKLLVRLASRSVTLLFIGFSATAVYLIFRLGAYLQERQQPHHKTIVSTLNALQIKILEVFWSRVSEMLVELENYRTVERRMDALIWKVFLFRAINAFAASLWISYGKTYCEADDCMMELRSQLITVFATYTAITAWTDVVMPLVLYWARIIRQDGIFGSRASSTKLRRQRCSVESQALMRDYDWRAAVDDHMTVTLQTGLVLLYFSVLPCIAMLALASHMLQIRADAFKLCYTHRRPFPDVTSGAGAWNDVMTLMARVAVVNNVALMLFTSDTVQLSTQDKILALLATERICAFLVWYLEHLVPATPRRVKIARKRSEVVLERLNEDRLRCERCHENAPDPHEPWPAHSAVEEEDAGSASPREAAKPPQYQLGREPRTLFDGLMAPHLRLLSRPGWQEAARNLQATALLQRQVSVGAQMESLTGTLEKVKGSSGLGSTIMRFLRPAKSPRTNRQIATVVPEARGVGTTKAKRKVGREADYFTYK
eukprot:TRINITY_DN11911_c0_g1_i1.p1 TRINITY_DN11911_c0_g1~~TRINITY_DN11911_c0_g1_i1.p1  ORF type:complete len:951 (+),score=158.41 TRINITY_DN11911_c0_g1_i1:116-2968(+)